LVRAEVNSSSLGRASSSMLGRAAGHSIRLSSLKNSQHNDKDFE